MLSKSDKMMQSGALCGRQNGDSTKLSPCRIGVMAYVMCMYTYIYIYRIYIINYMYTVYIHNICMHTFMSHITASEYIYIICIYIVLVPEIEYKTTVKNDHDSIQQTNVGRLDQKSQSFNKKMQPHYKFYHKCGYDSNIGSQGTD